MNNLIFITQGTWETTELFNNGAQIDATELVFNLEAGRDALGNPVPGGLSVSAALAAYLRVPNDPNLYPLFPGVLEFRTPDGNIFRVENMIGEDPAFLMVYLNNICVNDSILNLCYEINADTGAFGGYFALYQDNFILPDEIVQTTLF